MARAGRLQDMGNKVDPVLVGFFGLRVKHFRSVRGFTQEKLAELSDLHPETISRIERGKVQASISVLVALTAALDCRYLDLLQRQVDAEEKMLTLEEQELLGAWREIHPEARGHLLDFLRHR